MKYAVKGWIDFANHCIWEGNKSDFTFYTKLRFESPSLMGDIFDYVARGGIHLLPEGKHLLARSVMGVSESKKIFFNDELRPLPCEKKQMSPLEPTDFCIAQLAAKRRKAKAKAVVPFPRKS